MDELQDIAQRVREGSTIPGPLAREMAAQVATLFRHILTGCDEQVEASWVSLCAMVKKVEHVEWERDALLVAMRRGRDVH